MNNAFRKEPDAEKPHVRNSVRDTFGNGCIYSTRELHSFVFVSVWSCQRPLFFMKFHINETGNIGKHPSDRDRHPDAGFSDICRQDIRQSYTCSERYHSQDDGHARFLDCTIVTIQQKQTADSAVKSPLDPEITHTGSNNCSFLRTDKDPHQRCGKNTYHRRDHNTEKKTDQE